MATGTVETGIKCVTKHCEGNTIQFINSYYKKFYGSMMRLVKRYFCGKCGIFFSRADYEVSKEDVRAVKKGNERVWELVEPKKKDSDLLAEQTSEQKVVAAQ